MSIAGIKIFVIKCLSLNLRITKDIIWGSVEHEHRKEVKKAFDFQLESVAQYLKLIREGEDK